MLGDLPLSVAQHTQGDRMAKDDRGDLDLTKQIEIKDKEIETLNSVVKNLRKIIDEKESSLHNCKTISKEHKKINGKLQKEINTLKQEQEDMLKYP